MTHAIKLSLVGITAPSQWAIISSEWSSGDASSRTRGLNKQPSPRELHVGSPRPWLMDSGMTIDAWPFSGTSTLTISMRPFALYYLRVVFPRYAYLVRLLTLDKQLMSLDKTPWGIRTMHWHWHRTNVYVSDVLAFLTVIWTHFNFALVSSYVYSETPASKILDIRIVDTHY